MMPSLEIAAFDTTPLAFVTVSVYVKVAAGMLLSVAVLVIVMEVSGSTVRLVWAGSVGALFTSLTTTVKTLVAKNCFVLMAGPLVSETMVVNVLVLGP